MKKFLAILLGSGMMLSACTSNNVAQDTGTGAYFGAILGSAIGGIANGPRGSDVGTIVGMATGAVVGSAIGSAVDRAEQEKYRNYQNQRRAPYSREYQQSQADRERYRNDSGFDPTNSGDDRIEFEQGETERPYSTVPAKTYSPKSVSVDQLSKMMPGYRMNYNEDVEVRKATFVDRDGNGMLSAGEEAIVTFEIMNNSSAVIYDVKPTVVETTGNKHIHISPSILVESIMPGKGVKYTATVRADKKLKSGFATFRVAVRQGENDITSQIKEFEVKTIK
ncbi:MAG: hypothetical protein ACI4B3_06815 [Prevotella sp.]